MIALLDGDIFAYRAAASAENDPAEVAIWRCRDSVELCLDAVGADAFKVFLSDKKENNFRYAIYPAYKANRVKPPPIHLNAVKEYLLNEWQAIIATKQEADDALGIESFKDKEENSVICSIDKDLLQISGNHYNFVKQEKIYVTPTEGIRHFYKQMLIGDKADNIVGVEGIGVVKAGRLLDHIDNEQEMFEIVRGKYDTIDRLCINGQVLWIRRQENEYWRPPVDDTEDEGWIGSEDFSN